MCTGADVLHTECGWERGEVGTALARDEKNLPMNEKPTRLFVVDRPTFSWEIAEAARNDPNGFYHGMTVKQGQETFVLSGPPVVFVVGERPVRPDDGAAGIEGEQLSLF
jgi:hypothetical protein